MREEIRHQKPMWLWCSYCLRAEPLEYDDFGPLLYPCSACHDSMEPVTPGELAVRRYAATYPKNVVDEGTGFFAAHSGIQRGVDPTGGTDVQACDVADEPPRAASTTLPRHPRETAALKATTPTGGSGVRHVTNSTRGSTTVPAAAHAAPSPWCDVTEAGTLLACSRTQVFALIKVKRLHPVRDAPGKKRRVTRSSVMAYLEELSRPPKTNARASRATPTTSAPALPDKQAMASDLREQRKKLFSLDIAHAKDPK